MVLESPNHAHRPPPELVLVLLPLTVLSISVEYFADIPPPPETHAGGTVAADRAID